VTLRLAAAVLAAAALAGCGHGGGGRATVWITRDRGEAVLKIRHVPAGLTAMQALARVAQVKTRYAGRFVQAIDGVQGSLTRQHDWFYFVNGYESDRSAAEYRLRDGDVEWWDFRSWKHAMHVPVVVGAFPEPFLHGFDGKRRPAVVVYDDGTRKQAAVVARRLHARLVRIGAAVPRSANVLELVCTLGAKARVTTRMRFGGGPGEPIEYVARCAPDFERRVRFQYQVAS
jgi:hypothetical protein